MRFSVLALLLFPAFAVRAQIPPHGFTDPLGLLQAVAQTYADIGGPFRMEAVTETVQSTELIHEWKKTYLAASKGVGKQYRIETRSSYGSYIEDSDGTTEWVYLKEAKAYTRQPSPASGPVFEKVFSSGLDLDEAWGLRSRLEAEASGYRNAALLREETIDVDGRNYLCYVVHATSPDRKRLPGEGFRSDDTYWIDKSSLVFRKHVARTDTYLYVAQNVHVPMHEDTTTTYPLMDFHAQPSASEFQFAPPPEAEEVASFEPNFRALPGKPGSPLVGKALPAAALPSAAGEALQGKPLLIDYWATWCAPCREAMPSLERVSRNFAASGLQFITVDEDENAKEAADYLERHHYLWTNYHDEDSKFLKPLKGEAIPLTILVDSMGKITYYGIGPDEEGLSAALASLGFVAGK